MMSSISRPRAGWPAGAAAVLWCAAAASLVFGWLHFPQGQPSVTATVVNADPAMASPDVAAGLRRAWGVQQDAPQIDTAQSMRYQLLGVVAGASGQGSALIAIDGQPPKPYRVGQVVSEGIFLQSLGSREARLGAGLDGPSQINLSLPVSEPRP